MFCRKAFFLAGLTLCVSFECIGQVVTSAQNGYWHEPSTWSGGIVPTSTNCSDVHIAHPVRISTAVNAPSLEIVSTLDVESSGELDIIPTAGGGEIRVHQDGLLTVNGTLVGRDLVSYLALPENVQFHDGSTFHFLGASRGFIPIASWHQNSTLIVNGFAGSGYIAIAYSDSWKQEFGNVVWDCPSQISFVDLNGYLRNIRGDLVVRSTNNQTLRLSTTQKPVIQIGGDFRIEGPSEVWFTTLSDSARIHVGGNFEYYSSSNGPSYFTTRGRCHMEVGGAFRVDATGPLRICSGSADSTGVRKTTFVLHKGISVSRGTFIAPSPGSGLLIFSGNELQDVSTVAGAFSGNMNFHVNTEAVVDFKQSQISTLGMLRVRGHAKVGSNDPSGALQTGGGNFQTTNSIVFYPGSTLEYNGSAAQFVANGNPSHSGVNVIMNNSHGVTMLGDLIADDITVAIGALDLNGNAIRANGNLLTTSGSSLSNGDVVLTGGNDAGLTLSNSVLRNLILEKHAGTEVDVLAPLSVRGVISVLNQDITLKSNGYLTLISTDDMAGATAMVARIPSGSSIEGDVTVQRFMSGEGRLYRYISSPVESASVASLQDDFPVTGTFLNPSSGRGINPISPSLYYYQAGWQPFPTAGYAEDNLLEPGRGYAAFVRGNAASVEVDLTGRLNQGSVPLAVAYNESDDSDHTGWNLVGNPFASAIDWGNSVGWTRSANMGLVFAIRDNAEGRFRYSDGEVGDANGGLIASGQAFWVHASSANPELVVHEEAKSESDASFFRTKTEVDYIRIRLEGKGSRDEVHIRKKPGSGREVDPADAIKRWNDRLSLSVLSSDTVPLALSAVDVVSCEETYPLRMSYPPEDNVPAPVPPGSYTMSAEAFGLYGSADISLIDSFTRDTVNIDAYSFIVSDIPASAAMDRFTLLVRSRRPNEVTISADELACGDSLAIVRLNEITLPRGHYFAYVADHEYTFNDAGVAAVPLPISDHVSHTISVVARNLCQQLTLGEIAITPKLEPEAPLVHSQTQCRAGSVLLSVNNAFPEIRWYWYDDESQKVCLSISDTPDFYTPVLQRSKTYYVVAENRHGCRSNTIPVKAIVIPADTLQVWENHGFLYSTVPGTEWHSGGIQLYAGVSFEPQDPGVYTARVRLAECAFEKIIVFPENGVVELFPVPFYDLLNVVSHQTMYKIEVESIAGKTILEVHPVRNVYRMDTSNWPGGVYLVSVMINDRICVRRKIVKP